MNKENIDECLADISAVFRALDKPDLVAVSKALMILAANQAAILIALRKEAIGTKPNEPKG